MWSKLHASLARRNLIEGQHLLLCRHVAMFGVVDVAVQKRKKKILLPDIDPKRGLVKRHDQSLKMALDSVFGLVIFVEKNLKQARAQQPSAVYFQRFVNIATRLDPINFTFLLLA